MSGPESTRREPPRRFSGRVVAISLMGGIAVAAAWASINREQNLRARELARRDAEAAEATEAEDAATPVAPH